jgi:hypothetical protein
MAAAAQLAPAEAVNAYGVAFRDYSLQETPRQLAVKQFYTEQHMKQTYAFVQTMHAKHLGLNRREMSIWEAAGECCPRCLRCPRCPRCPHITYRADAPRLAELLNEVVDDSDPDLDLPQARRPEPSTRPRCRGHAPRFTAQQPRFALRAFIGGATRSVHANVLSAQRGTTYSLQSSPLGADILLPCARADPAPAADGGGVPRGVPRRGLAAPDGVHPRCAARCSRR